MFWCCTPICPLYCIIEELDCCFNIVFGLKGNIYLGLISYWWGVWSHPNLYELGCFSWFSACAVSVIKTGEWSEDRSELDVATAKCRRAPFVTQNSTRSGSLFLSDGQYVGSPVDVLFPPIVLSTSRLLAVTSLDQQSICLALWSPPAINRRPRVM
jgi:hypothetical protein